jgi:hypothetical protein
MDLHGNLSEDNLVYFWQHRPKYHGPKDTHICVSEAGWKWLLSVTVAARPKTPNIVPNIWGTPVVLNKYMLDDKGVVIERNDYGEFVPVQIVQLGELIKPMEAK